MNYFQTKLGCTAVTSLIILISFFHAPVTTYSQDEKDTGTVSGTITDRVCVVVYTERRGAIRIISARKANQRERKKYYEFMKRRKTEETR